MRMSLRRLMLVVAIAAAVLGFGIAPRWRLCSREIGFIASEERLLLATAETLAAAGRAAARRGNRVEAIELDDMAVQFRRLAEGRSRVQRDWERARWMPWWPHPYIESWVR